MPAETQNPQENRPETDKGLLVGILKKYDQQQRFAVENAIYRHGYPENPLTALLLEVLKHIKETGQN